MRTDPVIQRPVPDWATVHRELRRPNVTLALLWEEHRSGAKESALQGAKFRAEVLPHDGVERGQRFVKSSSKSPGSCASARGQRDALLLAAGHLRRILVRLLTQADRLDHRP